MTRYMLSVHSAADPAREPMTDEQMQHSWQAIGALEADMKSSGAWVYSGRLDDAAAATVVRPSKGRVSKVDGPYADTKEHLGGFYIIEAADADAALDWASKVTLAIDNPIEVRAFVGFAD